MRSRKSGHEQRFENWQRLAPPQTRLLCALVVDRVVPCLASLGFHAVQCTLGNPEWEVSGREVELERSGEGVVDTVTFNFDKHRRPRFQVHASRRSAQPPHPYVRAGNLVARASQYYHFWGKPWWLPSTLWSLVGAERTATEVATHIGQLVAMLENGERGRHVSRAT